MVPLLACCTGLLVWVAVFRPTALPFWTAASVTFWGMRPPDVPLGLDLSRIATSLAGIAVLVALATRFRHRPATQAGRLALFVCLTAIVGALLGYGDAQLLADPTLRGAQSVEWRGTVQTVQRLAFAGGLLLPYLAARRSPGESPILDGYLAGTTVQCVLGLYQSLAIAAGLPFLASPNMGNLVAIEGIPRAAGLAGEPRHLAAFLLPSIAVLAARTLYSELRGGTPRPSQRQIALLGLHLVTLLVTFSTSGWTLALLAAGLVVMLRPSRVLRTGGVLAVATAAVLLVTSVVQGSEPGFGGVWEQRMGQRLTQQTYRTSEFSSTAALDYMAGHPEALALGVGIGNPVFYFRTEPAYEYAPGVVRDPCGLVLLVFEAGLPLAAIFLGWTLWLLAAGLAVRRLPVVWGGPRACAALAGIVTMLVGTVGAGPLSPQFFLFVGEALCLGALARRSQVRPDVHESNRPHTSTVPAISYRTTRLG